MPQKRKAGAVLAAERELFKLRKERTQGSKKERLLLEQMERLEAEIDAFKQLGDYVSSHVIKPRERGTKSEATAVVLASDWHYEEEVKESNGCFNIYNLAIANERIDRFWQGIVRLWQVLSKDIGIREIVVALLGDLISGNIHESLLEVCQLPPVAALIQVQEQVISGIEFLLKHTPCTLVIPCQPGNHSRITKKLYISTEKENSLEWYLYYNLAEYFKGEKRVKFVISGGLHTVVQVYDLAVRFQHGWAIRYNGGIGGVSVPGLRKVSQWALNLPKEGQADLDCIGHLHQLADFGKLVINGALIGYTPYALQGAFPFQKPNQAFFLLDKIRGKTIMAPILV